MQTKKSTKLVLMISCTLASLFFEMLLGCGIKKTTNSSLSSVEMTNIFKDKLKIEPITNSKILVPFLKNNGKYILVDSVDFKPVNQTEYDVIYPFSEGYALMKKSGKFGYIKLDGNEDSVLNKVLHYSAAGNFHCGLAAVISTEGKMGFIDKNGKEIFPCKYAIVSIPHHSSCNKTSLDYDERSIIDLDPFHDFSFKDGVAIVAIDSPMIKFGLINVNGRELTQFKYNFIAEFNNGVAKVGIDGNCADQGCFGYINIQGQQLTDINYGVASCFYDNFGYLQDEHNGYLVGKSGDKLTLKEEYILSVSYPDDISGTYNHNLNDIRVSDRTYITRNTDKGVNVLNNVSFNSYNEWNSSVSYVFDKSLNVRYFSEGLAVANINPNSPLEENVLRGYVNGTGKWIISPSFEFCRNFSEGLAAIKKNGKWGYISKNGTIVIPTKYHIANDFKNNIAIVEVDTRKYILVNRSGKESPVYDHIFNRSEGKILVGNYFGNGKHFGFYDTMGFEIVAPKYIAASHFINGIALVVDDSKHVFFIDANGREFIQR